MGENNDTLIMIVTKLVLLIGFIYGLKYWFNKSKSIIPVVLYWLFGLIFILLISYTIFDWLIINAINSDKYGSLSAIFAIVLYFYFGLKNFKK